MLKTLLRWMHGGGPESSGDPLGARRAALNREIARLSVANIGLLFLWGALAAQHNLTADHAGNSNFDLTHHGLVAAAALLTLAIWVALIVSLARRLLYWFRHERNSSESEF